MAKAKDVLKRIKDEEIEWLDLRFTDPRGKFSIFRCVPARLAKMSWKTA